MSGGGSYRPRSYGRQHDFKYEREPQPKPPKEVETHYLKEENTPDPPRIPFRPEVAPVQVGRIVNENLQKYFEKEPEQTAENDKTDYGIEADTLDLGWDVIPNEFSTPIREMENIFELTVEQPEPMLERSLEPSIEPSIENGPELYKSYELPVNDLELLLAELDANPLETNLELNQAEKLENAERSV